MPRALSPSPIGLLLGLLAGACAPGHQPPPTALDTHAWVQLPSEGSFALTDAAGNAQAARLWLETALAPSIAQLRLAGRGPELERWLQRLEPYAGESVPLEGGRLDADRLQQLALASGLGEALLSARLERTPAVLDPDDLEALSALGYSGD